MKKYGLNNSDKIFGVIYRHSGYSATEFPSSFEATIEKLTNQKLKYICGDINIDFSDMTPMCILKTTLTCSVLNVFH